MMMMMINHCDGYPLSSKPYANQCNDTTAERPTLLVEETEDFFMDTEEHRRILVQQNYIGEGALVNNNPACGNNCEGLYNVKHRQCLKIYRCRD